MDGMPHNTAPLTAGGPEEAEHFRKRGVTAIDPIVGGRLRLAREAAGISRRDLAATLGISTQQLYKYEHGTNRLSVSFLYHAASSLGVPMASLLAEEQPAPAGRAPLAVEDEEQAVLRFVLRHMSTQAARAGFMTFLAAMQKETETRCGTE